jgi:hypothetical protein
MSTNTAARRAAPQVDQSERAWWLRALAVLQAPTAVFAALRDDSQDAAAARQEPVTAIVILAGIAGVLAAPETGRLMDDPALDSVTVPVVIFLSGALYGVVAYWLGAAALQLAAERLGSRGTYRRSRHVLAYAAVPLILSLVVVWPLRLAIYGDDVLETGGRDSGVGGDVFTGLELAFVAWAAVLLVVGVRAVHGWAWGRALAASALTVVLTALLLGLVVVILRGA